MNKNLQETKPQSGALQASQPKPQGFDDVDPNDYMLPRVELLQDLSPAVKDRRGNSGDLVNSLTKEPLVSNVFVPIFVKKSFIRWQPRREGGGIVYQTTDRDDPRVIQDSQWVDGEKPLCTSYLNFVALFEGDTNPIILSFHNTSFNVGRTLLTMARMTNQDMYRTRYELSSVLTKNAMGEFYKFGVKKLGPASDLSIEMAQAVYAQLYSVDIKVDQTDANDEE